MGAATIPNPASYTTSCWKAVTTASSRRSRGEREFREGLQRTTMPLPLPGVGRSDLHLQVALAHHGVPWRRVQEVLAASAKERQGALRSRPDQAARRFRDLFCRPKSQAHSGAVAAPKRSWVGIQSQRRVARSRRRELRTGTCAWTAAIAVACLGLCPRARSMAELMQGCGFSGFAPDPADQHSTGAARRRTPGVQVLAGQAGPAMAGCVFWPGSREISGGRRQR